MNTICIFLFPKAKEGGLKRDGVITTASATHTTTGRFFLGENGVGEEVEGEKEKKEQGRGLS